MPTAMEMLRQSGIKKQSYPQTNSTRNALQHPGMADDPD